MDIQQRIQPRMQRLLRTLHALAQVGTWVWPLCTVGMWFVLEYIPLSQLQRMAGWENPGAGAALVIHHAPFQITWTVKLVGAFVSLLPAALEGLFLLNWTRLLGLYRQGRIFESENVECFERMGRWMLLLSAFDIFLSRPLYSVALTLSNPPGYRTLTIGLSSEDVPTLAFGAGLLVIGWVMREGCRLRREADLVV